MHATLTVPQFALSKESLDFGTCLVGQTRELQTMILNTTSSHSKWAVTQESRSESCAYVLDTFQVSPSAGLLKSHITHISDIKALLKIFFTAKGHKPGYSGTATKADKNNHGQQLNPNNAKFEQKK